MAGMAGAPCGAKVYLRVKLANLSGRFLRGRPRLHLARYMCNGQAPPRS